MYSDGDTYVRENSNGDLEIRGDTDVREESDVMGDFHEDTDVKGPSG